MVMVVVNLAGQPHFFVETVVGWTIGLAISETVGLAIDGATSTRTDVTVGIFALFL